MVDCTACGASWWAEFAVPVDDPTPFAPLRYVERDIPENSEAPQEPGRHEDAICRSCSRWTQHVSVDAGIHVHDLAAFLTDRDALARSIAILRDRATGAPRGRGATQAEELQRKADARASFEAAKPIADQLLRTIDADLNGWMRWMLVIQPAVSAMSREQVWEILEVWPADNALELLAVPAVQRHLRAIRTERSSSVRSRLKRAFQRLAMERVPAGRRKKRGLTHAGPKLRRSWENIYRDVTELRQWWKGDLAVAECSREALKIIERHAPLTPKGGQVKLIRTIIDSDARPVRIAEQLMQAAHPDLSIPQIRQVARTQQS
jgi:hypothetical protein